MVLNPRWGQKKKWIPPVPFREDYMENEFKIWGLLLFSYPVMFDSSQPNGLQYARPLCPSPSPRVCPSSHPLHWWWHPASHLLLPSSPSALNLSQHQHLFQWVGCSHPLTKVLELQFQHQSFQWVFRIDFLKKWLVDSHKTHPVVGKSLCKSTGSTFNSGVSWLIPNRRTHGVQGRLCRGQRTPGRWTERTCPPRGHVHTQPEPESRQKSGHSQTEVSMAARMAASGQLGGGSLWNERNKACQRTENIETQAKGIWTHLASIFVNNNVG